MVGFKLQSPVPQLSAEQLAQLGLAAFRPPGVKGAPSTPGFNMPSGGGDGGLGAGMAGLGAGIGALGKMGGVSAVGSKGSGPGGAYTTAEAMDMAGMGGDPSSAGYGVPSMPAAASGGGFWDFLSGIFSSGGGSSAAGGLGGLTDAGSWGGSMPDFTAIYARGGKVVPHFFQGGFAAPDIKPIDLGIGQAFDPYDPGASLWGAFDNDNPEFEDNQGEGIGRGAGGMAGSLIGSIWGPIGQMAGREIGQKVGGGIGAAVQGDWGGAAESLVEGTPFDFIFNKGGAVPGANMVPPAASPSGGAQVDDVTAQVSVGEFVMPKDVTAWLGEKHMQGMVEAARAELANRTAAPEMAPVKPSAPTFLSEGARKGGRHA
jgi:hypothetical protein